MIMYSTTQTKPIMKRTTSLASNLSNINLQQSAKRAQGTNKQSTQHEQPLVTQTRSEETVNSRAQVVYYKPINLSQQLERQAQQPQQEAMPKQDEKKYRYSKPSDTCFFRDCNISNLDYDYAYYILVNRQYEHLDDLDNMERYYKNK